MSDALPELAPVATPFYRDAVRVAGALLLTNVVLVLMETAVMAGSPDAGRPNVVSAVIDVVIGTSLVRGETKYHTFAVIRAVLGMVFTLGMGVYQGDLCGSLFAAVGMGGILLTLTAGASLARLALGAGLFGLYTLVAVVAAAVVGVAG